MVLLRTARCKYMTCTCMADMLDRGTAFWNVCKVLNDRMFSGSVANVPVEVASTCWAHEKDMRGGHAFPHVALISAARIG